MVKCRRYAVINNIAVTFQITWKSVSNIKYKKTIVILKLCKQTYTRKVRNIPQW